MCDFHYVCFCTSKLNFSCALKMSLVRKYTVFREELCCPGEKEREKKCVCLCVRAWIVYMDCLHVFVSFSLMAINQHEFGRVKVQTVLSFVFTISATLTFSCNHRKTVHRSLSLLVSLSVFLIGVQHPPTSCQEKVPSRSSERANYCLGRLMPRGPSQTSRTSRRALPRLPGDGEGKAGQTPGPLPQSSAAPSS